MTFREKHIKLQDQQFVEQMIVNSSYHTMWLEGQAIAKAKVKKLYELLIKSKKKK